MPSEELNGRWLPGLGIVRDVRARLPYYKDDWIQGCNWGVKVFAPATYIFFASALPALAFGQQLAMDTEGTLNVVHVLVATVLSGLAQAVAGGQPLLIIGVAEPIVIIYGFCYSFAKGAPGLGAGLFLPWAGWICVWTSACCLLLALSGACSGIDKFTRFSGELFGALIAILFFQVGIKGIVHEFQPAKSDSLSTNAALGSSSTGSSSSSSYLLLINGLWGLFLAAGVLLTCIKVLQARRWLLGRAWLRGFLADYGVPLLVVAWSAASFAVGPAPGVPRRVLTPNTWEVSDSWAVASRMAAVPGTYIAAALLPAVIISVLFYFDHNVSSQMAQQPEFNLVKPPAYHYDFLLLAGLTLLCGLLGIPPVNGVLPQAPMHTRSLAHIRKRKGLTSTLLQSTAPQAEPEPVRTIEVQLNELPTAAATAAMGPQLSAFANSQHNDNCPSTTATGSPRQTAYGATSHATQSTLDQQQQQHGGRASSELRHRSLSLNPGSPRCSGSLNPGSPRCSGSPISPQRCQQQQQQQQWCNSQQQATLAGGTSSHQHHHHQQQHPQQQQRAKILKEASSQVALNTLPDSAAAAVDGGSGGGPPDDVQEEVSYLKLEVREQRVTNLLQSLLVALCLAITPAIQLIPTAVLWGYFIFMAVESLTGSQLWERLLLLLTDPKKRVAVMQQEHAAYLQLVPYRAVVRFTLLQLVYLLGVWALTTWAGIAGVAFPLPIMALVPLRQYLLPKLFDRQQLAALDAASYEEAPPIHDRLQAAHELYSVGAISSAPAPPLPVTDSDLDQLVPGGSAVLPDDDEGELISQEFHGYQLRHHITQQQLEHHKPH